MRKLAMMIGCAWVVLCLTTVVAFADKHCHSRYTSVNPKTGKKSNEGAYVKLNPDDPKEAKLRKGMTVDPDKWVCVCNKRIQKEGKCDT